MSIGLPFDAEYPLEGRALEDLPDVVAEVNARIREIAARSAARTDDWDFICECGDPACKERVTLSVAAYEELQKRHEPVLAPGH